MQLRHRSTPYICDHTSQCVKWRVASGARRALRHPPGASRGVSPRRGPLFGRRWGKSAGAELSIETALVDSLTYLEKYTGFDNGDVLTFP